MDQAAILDNLNKLDEILIKNVKLLMKRRGWNQSELGRRLGIEPNKISRFLTKGAWDSDLLEKTASVFGCPPHELLTGRLGDATAEQLVSELSDALSDERFRDSLADLLKSYKAGTKA